MNWSLHESCLAWLKRMIIIDFSSSWNEKLLPLVTKRKSFDENFLIWWKNYKFVVLVYESALPAISFLLFLSCFEYHYKKINFLLSFPQNTFIWQCTFSSWMNENMRNIFNFEFEVVHMKCICSHATCAQIKSNIQFSWFLKRFSLKWIASSEKSRGKEKRLIISYCLAENKWYLLTGGKYAWHSQVSNKLCEHILSGKSNLFIQIYRSTQTNT